MLERTLDGDIYPKCTVVIYLGKKISTRGHLAAEGALHSKHLSSQRVETKSLKRIFWHWPPIIDQRYLTSKFQRFFKERTILFSEPTKSCFSFSVLAPKKFGQYFLPPMQTEACWLKLKVELLMAKTFLTEKLKIGSRGIRTWDLSTFGKKASINFISRNNSFKSSLATKLVFLLSLKSSLTVISGWQLAL